MKPSASIEVHYACTSKTIYKSVCLIVNLKYIYNLRQLQCRPKVKLEFFIAVVVYSENFSHSLLFLTCWHRSSFSPDLSKQFVANFNSCNFFLMRNISIANAAYAFYAMKPHFFRWRILYRMWCECSTMNFSQNKRKTYAIFRMDCFLFAAAILKMKNSGK